MITIRRAEERHIYQRRKRIVCLTFYPRDRADPLADGFQNLESVSEQRLSPHADAARRRHQNVEILTYVREGALAYQNSTGSSGVIHAGEFQRMTFGRSVHRSETNASGTHWAHVFQVLLRPSQTGLEQSHEQKRFSAAERRGNLCLVASSDARKGSLRIHQDASVYSAMLDPGRHVVHEISPGRSAWLHLVKGEARIGDIVLTTGDGAGFAAERVASLTAQEETEILYLDLSAAPPKPAT